jgi:hypothetical protein
MSSLGPTMIPNAWRERLTYTVMSVFVAWHSLAIVIAPAPASAMAKGLRAPVQAYLTLLRLDNLWNFFAPIVGTTPQLRYVIEDKAGEKLTFAPETEFRGPSYIWFKAWHYAIMDHPEDYADIAAARYCRKHAALHPVSITLLEVEEKDFTPADFLAGKQRWDPDFVTVSVIKFVTCPAE